MIHSVMESVGRAVSGSQRAKVHALVALVAEGHLLIEDVPGTGKTSLARALSESIDGTWKRIQFTPDLLPSDVTGSQIFNQRLQDFEFHPGPVFANIVLADEINRASPKTQSALLEVMEERQTTSDGDTYLMPRPFVVIATQNPIELEGTYPLPEAQLDRFLLRTSLGYLSEADEIEVLLQVDSPDRPSRLSPVMTASDVMDLINLAKRVHVERNIAEFVAAVARLSREHPAVRLGISTRGTTSMIRAARALALVCNRKFVTADDVYELLEPVFAHRMIIEPEYELRGTTAAAVLAEIAQTVTAPTARRTP